MQARVCMPMRRIRGLGMLGCADLSSIVVNFRRFRPIAANYFPGLSSPTRPCVPNACAVHCHCGRPRLCTRAGTPLYILSFAGGRIERTARVSLRPSRREMCSGASLRTEAGWLRVKISVTETVLTWNACPPLLAPARWPRLNTDAGHIPADHACLRVGRVSAC